MEFKEVTVIKIMGVKIGSFKSNSKSNVYRIPKRK